MKPHEVIIYEKNGWERESNAQAMKKCPCGDDYIPMYLYRKDGDLMCYGCAVEREEKCSQ